MEIERWARDGENEHHIQLKTSNWGVGSSM
jgi:hypothetical protein